MTCTPEQVKLLMKYAVRYSLEASAAKAGMSLETARKYYRKGGQMAQKKPRDYRTREDGFAADWAELEEMLGEEKDPQRVFVLCERLFWWLAHPALLMVWSLGTDRSARLEMMENEMDAVLASAIASGTTTPLRLFPLPRAGV